jgi:hypothetical protein
LFNFWFYLLLFLVLGKKCFFPCENVLWFWSQYYLVPYFGFLVKVKNKW